MLSPRLVCRAWCPSNHQHDDGMAILSRCSEWLSWCYRDGHDKIGIVWLLLFSIHASVWWWYGDIIAMLNMAIVMLSWWPQENRDSKCFSILQAYFGMIWTWWYYRDVHHCYHDIIVIFPIFSLHLCQTMWLSQVSVTMVCRDYCDAEVGYHDSILMPSMVLW